MIPVSYNLRNLTVRKTTTLAAALGLALVVFVFASTLMLANGIERTLGRTGSDDVAMVLRKGANAELESVRRERHHQPGAQRQDPVPAGLWTRGAGRGGDRHPAGQDRHRGPLQRDHPGDAAHCPGVPAAVKLIAGRAAPRAPTR